MNEFVLTKHGFHKENIVWNGNREETQFKIMD